MTSKVNVIKRNGKKEAVNLEKISSRIEKQSYKLNEEFINSFEVAKKVVAGVYDGVTTRELDQLATETAATLATIHPDYSTLASRLAITALHKDTSKSFTETTKLLRDFINPKTNKHAPLVSDSYYNTVMNNSDELDSAIVHSRDFNFDFFGFKTLEKSYLLKIDNNPVERPQYLWMRTAIGIHGDDIDSVLNTYNMLSEGFFTHATPTLFNAGTPRPQLSSCFLLDTQDSIEGIFDTLKESGLISKNAGGIGINFSPIRASGSYISGTNGTSNGILPFLKIFNETARAVDQCFVGETMVTTKKGLKQIKDVVGGDEVLTSDGNYNKVESRNDYNKVGVNLVTIETNDGDIQVTENHLLLAALNVDMNDSKDIIKKKIMTGNIKLDWIEAGKLTNAMKIVKY